MAISDKRFKWLLIAGCLTCFAIAFIWKYPDIVRAHNGRNYSSGKVGDYLYVDQYYNVHSDRKCTKLNSKGNKSTRIKTEELCGVKWSGYDLTFCPKCVNDDAYQDLMKIQGNSVVEEEDSTVLVWDY